MMEVEYSSWNKPGGPGFLDVVCRWVC